MVRIAEWTVVSSFAAVYIKAYAIPLAVFKSLGDALEYAAFVNDYDEENFRGWLTYVIEGDWLHLNPDQK